MKRLVLEDLREWRDSEDHKVLLVRGARQVGKTYSIRKFGQEFDNYVEVNLEKDKDVHMFFDGNLNPDTICENLSAYYGKPIVEGKTLLFFDEVQSCERAMVALRYFYEDKQGLHVVAAGSLLEFALEDISSWGVGRVHSLFMYPLSFDEFLLANGEDNLFKLKRSAFPENPLAEPFHNRLLEYLKKFMIVGGMPEAVRKYISRKTNMRAVQKVLSDITLSYYDDFAKYKKRSPLLRLREVMDSVVKQAGGKYIYSKAGELSNPNQAKEALELLELAGLVHRVYHSSGQGVPLGAEVNYKMFKALLIDTGLFQKKSGLKLGEYLLAENVDMLNKGSIAENFVGMELIKYSDYYDKAQLYYWHREKRGSSAEVDFLLEYEGAIVPLEVKSGRSGRMQSMHKFLEERNSKRGIRISMENFSKYDKIEVVPLYAVSNLFL